MSGVRWLFTLALVPACVATNPRWDGPPNESVARDSDDGLDDAEASGFVDTGGPSGEATTAFGGTGELDTGDATTGPGAGPEPDPTTEPPMMCPGMEQLCDGECRNVDKDKHYCGAECLDCDALFDGDGECRMGVCVDKDAEDD